ncbi:hypothetical protein RUM43_013328 [Polyplax serrata]|uniref:Alanyl-transfer RNA synthetases family profile domain-containing protein n=1 Tax=Polyplax serrata TaxID=468196 RepID=A0AAN8Q2M9_POLSC
MVFACQRDSFQRQLSSKVKSCTKGVGEYADFYEVICEDSVLFPEGGGQPCDTGFINDIAVEQVLRRGNEAVMYVKEPVTIGEEVTQRVNWDRRLDHMQQHSGQHLITAIINAEYKIDTTSWWLGDKVSHIELETKQLTDKQIKNIEMLANEKILKQSPVVVKLCNIGDESLKVARTRGLPNNVSGPIRIVEITGMERDLCCGTHVNNLGELQCIKLLHAEKGKKNKTNLFFLTGNRVLKYLSECLNRECGLTQLLKNEPASHVDLVKKLQQNLKITNKKLMVLLKEIAICEAEKFRRLKPKPRYYAHHNKEAESDYLENFWRTVRDDESIEQTFFMLAAGTDTGSLLLQGDEHDLLILGPKIADILGGKGYINGRRFQAKVSKLGSFSDAQKILSLHFDK